MKAISVFPGKPNSVHVADLPKPSLDQVPNGRGVLVKVLRVGVDGTDKEINAAEYGAAPSESTFRFGVLHLVPCISCRFVGTCRLQYSKRSGCSRNFTWIALISSGGK
jgi:threonine dehydrogenase-like Zn-dependent dehydrogenase